ncbi:hypothetical protein FDZ71_08055, partial [bacterium]
MTASISLFDENSRGGAVGVCPQCGGEVSMEVGERILSCRFCRTGLYISTRGPLVYRLPLSAEYKGKEVFYLPFWRIKGLRYKVASGTGEVEAHLLDLTAPAQKLMPKGANLGIRPQAWRLTLSNWPPLAPVADVPLSGAVNEEEIERLTGSGGDYLFTRLIGEAVYLLLAPFTTTEKNGKALLEGLFPDGPKYWITIE